jgi:large conductance mechanosensitive channel
MKSFIQEFKDFAIKGNMIDMAVAIIIGTAFNNVVNVLVKKVVMPPLAMLTDGVNYSDRTYVLKEAFGDASEIAIGYGALIEAFVDFSVIALTIFIVIKSINRFKKKSEDPKNIAVVTPKDIELLSKIEDLMQEQNELLRAKRDI